MAKRTLNEIIKDIKDSNINVRYILGELGYFGFKLYQKEDITEAIADNIHSFIDEEYLSSEFDLSYNDLDIKSLANELANRVDIEFVNNKLQKSTSNDWKVIHLALKENLSGKDISSVILNQIEKEK